MNGPLKMYKLTRIVQPDIEVELPQCMYRMNNIHSARNGVVVEQSPNHVTSTKDRDILDQNNENNKEMAELEVRQEAILHQLAELKKQMDSIRTHLSNMPVKESTTAIQSKSKVSRAIDPSSLEALPSVIILNASSTHLPFSIKLLQKLFKDVISLNVSTYTHSSISQLNEKNHEFANMLKNFSANPTVPKLDLRLIWKDDGANLELVVGFTKIQGEVNFLRYIARLVPNILPYENCPELNEIDHLLDVIYNLAKTKTKTARIPLLQTLNKSLGKNLYFVGRFTIVDVAAYSTFKQNVTQDEINVNLSKWLERVEKL